MSLTTRLQAARESRPSLAARATRAPERRPVRLPAEVTAAMSRVLDRERPAHRAELAAAASTRDTTPMRAEVAGAVPGNTPAVRHAPEGVSTSDGVPSLDATDWVDVYGDGEPLSDIEIALPPPPPTPLRPEPAGRSGDVAVHCVACRGEVEILRIDLTRELLEGACRGCGLETTRSLGEDALHDLRDLVDGALEDEVPSSRRHFWQVGTRPA